MEFVVCMYISVFYFYNDNFILLMYDLYFRVCLRFVGDGCNLSIDEIEYVFLT
jgi:hypothetical protein